MALENYITKAYDDNSEVAKNQEKVEDKQTETEIMEMFYSLATLILQEQKEDLQKNW